jgi:hypothetical protein
MIAKSDKMLNYSGFGPINARSSNNYVGRIVNPITNSVSLIGKPSSKLVNPLSVRSMLPFL